MRVLVLALVLCMGCFASAAQETLATRTLSGEDLRVKPSLSPLVSVLFGINGDVSTSVTVVFDARGNVTHLRLDTPTPSKALDDAILGWAAGLKIRTTEAGIGTVPMKLSVH